MPARLIRRKPLTQRIIAYLSPLDFFLWLSAELDSSDWDQCQARWVVSIGITFNFVFLIARANNGLGTLKRQDDVFKESKGHIGWLKFCVRLHSAHKSNVDHSDT